MNYISVMAVTEDLAREQAAIKTGYAPETIGRVILVIDEGDNSRQRGFVFQTMNDVTEHLLYVRAKLSDACDVPGKKVNDGPMLMFGREVTAGG